MREKLVLTAMELLEQREGLRGVNLREIARKAGCAHTNAYNYFDGYQALIWAAFQRILERLESDTEQRMHPQGTPEHNFREFIACQVDFALAHPGWYRVLWLESLPGVPPPEIMDYLRKLNRMFLERLQQRLGKQIEKKQLRWLGDLVHGFMHGQICKLISGRLPVQENRLSKTSVVQDSEWMLKRFGILKGEKNHECEI